MRKLIFKKIMWISQDDIPNSGWNQNLNSLDLPKYMELSLEDYSWNNEYLNLFMYSHFNIFKEYRRQ